MSLWHETPAGKRRAAAWHALKRCGWNQSEAAHRLGVRREILNRAIRQWGGAKALMAQPHVESGITCDSCSQEHNGNGNSGEAVTLNSSPALTSGRSKPTLGRDMQDSIEAPAVVAERIPPVTVELSPEEDFFVSTEIAKNRLAGGPKTRTHVLRAALRFFMEAKKDPAKEPRTKAKKEKA